MRYLLDKINELACKEKVSGLTAEEKNMQTQLRKKYVGLFRNSMEYMLMHATVIDPNGMDVTPLKLKCTQKQVNKPNRSMCD